ncbi:sigma-54-dependent Fis family transcriptional regulator [Neokomagataea tanensis]|uniref:Sigma-54-dependent Fis family transcriptional regulator n=1 Tax=Neokomagataea tanensis TaxID=661191 RepID=A0A4Y6V7J8_9PROT|nr:sigma-54-dependent Fis family transcriptional regulator [Neokomagataea tanensis]
MDDDTDIQTAARLLFRREGIKLLVAGDTTSALTYLSTHQIDLVLLDLNYSLGARSGTEGIVLLKEILLCKPTMPVVVVTGHSGITIAVEAMRAGAKDFVMKPWNNNRLVALVQKILTSTSEPEKNENESIFIASSPATHEIIAKIDKLAPTLASVLLCGPAGSGKKTLAKRIHTLSKDNGTALLLNYDEDLSQQTNTFLCENIELLHKNTQSKLLQKLDENNFIRLIATTSKSYNEISNYILPKLMLRLDSAVIEIPSLEKRSEDIESLTQFYLHYYANRHGLPEPALDQEHFLILKTTLWPHGVNSLKAAIEKIVLHGAWIAPHTKKNTDAPRINTLKDNERFLIEETLKKNSFNVTHAAQELGLTRPALYRRMARYGL